MSGPLSRAPTLSRTAALPSRDRQGAVSLRRVRPSQPNRIRYEHRHRLALPLHDVSNRFANVPVSPQPARAAMPSPVPSMRRIKDVQPPARVSLEVVQDLFRQHFRFDDDMHVVRANVRGEQHPAAMRANLPQRIEDRRSRVVVEQTPGLTHLAFRCPGTNRIGLQQSTSHAVVQPVYGTGLVAMQMSAVADERDQVSHIQQIHRSLTRAARNDTGATKY
jgi:hypothetical protein